MRQSRLLGRERVVHLATLDESFGANSLAANVWETVFR